MNAAESKIEALRREVYEELGVSVDESKPVYYLGGWSRSKARDNYMNDSFGSFAVTVKDKAFRTDHMEIFEAQWFDWKALLRLWSSRGKPLEKKVRMVLLALPQALTRTRTLTETLTR